MLKKSMIVVMIACVLAVGVTGCAQNEIQVPAENKIDLQGESNLQEEGTKSREHENLSLKDAKSIIWKLEGDQEIYSVESNLILGKQGNGTYGYYTYSSWNGFNTVDEAMEELGDICVRSALEYLIKKDVYDIFNGKIGYHGTNEMWDMIDKENSNVRFKVDEEDYKEVEVELFLDGYYNKEYERNWESTAVYTFKYIDDRWKVICIDGYSRADFKDGYNNKTYVGGFFKINASSELVEGNIDYSAGLVDDSVNGTAWVEGAHGDGISEWIAFEHDKEIFITGMDIANGYFKSEEVLKNNNRVKKIKVEFDNGQAKTFDLEDLDYASYTWPMAYQFQTLDFEEVIRTKSIKVTILEVYKGEKFSDTCISEIKFIEEKR